MSTGSEPKEEQTKLHLANSLRRFLQILLSQNVPVFKSQQFSLANLVYFCVQLRQKFILLVLVTSRNLSILVTATLTRVMAIHTVFTTVHAQFTMN